MAAKPPAQLVAPMVGTSRSYPPTWSMTTKGVSIGRSFSADTCRVLVTTRTTPSVGREASVLSHSRGWACRSWVTVRMRLVPSR